VDADGSLITRAELLKKFRISDASERRRRSGAADWPPHLLIGKKIYYRQSQVEAWVRRREASCQGSAEAMSAEAVSWGTSRREH
jgi:hypothetical protein